MKKKYRLEVRQLSKDELAYFEEIGCKIDKFHVEVFDDCREWDAICKIIYRHSRDRKSIEEIEEHMKGAGFYPPFAVDPQIPCCWTQEYFTSGQNEWFTVWRDMIISHDVYMKIREYKFTGLDYIPMREW